MAPKKATVKRAGELEFQRLSPEEHVLQRPDLYVGPNDPVEGHGRLLGADLKRTEPRSWQLSPIFLKIFDEALVNALDASRRDATQRRIAVTFVGGEVCVENDGVGLPVTPFLDREQRPTDRLVPEVVFSEVNAGSNFDDGADRFGGGRNGVGITCCNIWSERFEVLVEDKLRRFRQVFERNMTVRGRPEVEDKVCKQGRVRVTFRPDYARLGLDPSLPVLEELLRTRAAEAAICARAGVEVTFQGARLPAKPQLFAAELFGGAELLTEELGRTEGPGATVIVGARSCGEDFCGFVNGVRCDGGTLAAHVREKLHRAVCELARKQKCAAAVRPQTVREHLAVLCVALVDKPRFTSQSKESLSTPAKAFGFSVDFSPRFLQKLARSAGLEAILRQETERDLAQNLRKVAPSRREGPAIEKYDPALDCRRCPLDCTLILTEGDSAKALAVAGLAVLGRERFGVYPLRGVPLNVRNVPLSKALKNKEIEAVLRILNVQPGGSPATLRYGRVAIMSDQDLDGAHICGMLLDNLKQLLPEVLAARPDFVCRIVTPLLRATPKSGGGRAEAFFTMQAYRAWAQTARLDAYGIKYYKGLGTNSSREAREIFRELPRHTVTFELDARAEERLHAYFDDKQADERKRILTEDYSPDLELDYGAPRVKVSDFLDREFIHFSQYSVFRSIASALDGLTPSRRKVLFYFLGLKGAREVKVAQAAAAVAQKTLYLHGESSLVETIVGLAQEQVGVNNVALLEPLGQFGSRLDPPKCHAAARYIFTRLAPVARALFPAEDDDVLPRREEEGEAIEPVSYVPVIPLALVNGVSGIATGFATSVPCFSVGSVVACCRAAMRGEPLPPLQPHYEGFVGSLAVTAKGVVTTGVMARRDARTVVVTELPVGRWTDPWLTELKEGGEKAKFQVASVVNLSSDTKVRVEVGFAEDVSGVPDESLAAFLKLSTSVPATFMYLHDAEYKLRLFESYHDVVRCHASERLRLFGVRKEAQLGKLQLRIQVAEAKAAFVELVVSGRLRLLGSKRAQLESELAQLGLQRLRPCAAAGGAPDGEGAGAEEEASGGYGHLLSMPFSSCTEESICKLRADAEALRAEHDSLRAKSPAELWEEALVRFEQAYEAYLQQRRERQAGAAAEGSGDGDAPRAGGKKRGAAAGAAPPKRGAKARR